MASVTARARTAGRWLTQEITPLQWVSVGWVLVFSVVVAYLFVRVTVLQDRQTTATCRDWRALAAVDVTSATTEQTRSRIRTAVDNYGLIGCDRRLGPLGPVDPAAYVPAPRATGN